MGEKNHGKQLIDLAETQGATGAAVIEVARIPFRREFRAACEQNTCGRFGTNWMCTPDVGDIDEMIARAKGYRHAFVFQYIGALEDSYDIEGMQEAARRHNEIAQALTPAVEEAVGEVLKLGAGGCPVCERCTRLDNIPCRHPDKAMASLESYGIAVSELAPLCGLKYINGQNTVTYFGGFLYN